MTGRRLFLKTLVLSALAPLGKMLGLWQGMRVFINGVPIAVPDTLDVRIEVGKKGYCYPSGVKITLVGGTLQIRNEHGAALKLELIQDGVLHLIGLSGIEINQRDPVNRTIAPYGLILEGLNPTGVVCGIQPPAPGITR